MQALVLTSSHHRGLIILPLFILILPTSFLIHQIALSACLQASQFAAELKLPQDLHKHLWNLAVWRQLWTTAPARMHLDTCICTLADFWKELLSMCTLFMFGKISLKAKNIKKLFLWSGVVCFYFILPPQAFNLAKRKDSFSMKQWHFPASSSRMYQIYSYCLLIEFLFRTKVQKDHFSSLNLF